MPERRFTPRDIHRQVLLQGLDLAPDGSFVVYGRRTIEAGKYVARLWRVPWRGGRPEPLTNGEVDGRPRISPDGRSLLFVSKRGDGPPKPYVMSLAGGEPRPLAELPGPTFAASWSPDGEQVLVIAASGEDRFRIGPADDPLARRITDMTWRLDGFGVRDQHAGTWIVPARGGKPTRLTGPDYDVKHAFWSPDGRRVGFLADRSNTAGLWEKPQVWSLPAGGGRPKAEPTLPNVWAADWSRDGTLALIGFETEEPRFYENPQLHVVVRRRLRRLAPELDLPLGNWTISDLVDTSTLFTGALRWLDETSVVTVVARRGRSHPYRFGLDGSVEQLAQGDFVTSNFTVGGGRVAIGASEGAQPGDVYAVENGVTRRLTRDGARWFGPFRRNDIVNVRFGKRSGGDFEGWLVPARSRGPRRRPLVLQIHGGPYLAYGPPLSTTTLALAGAGFHVLYTNPRGSMGYGEEFAKALHGAWGEPDTGDQLRALQWAVKEGYADRNRVGLIGGSYGGYMVSWLLGHHPGRFAAAVCENPVSDLVSEFGHSDFGFFSIEGAAGVRFPHDDPARVREKSPSAHIHRNRTPLLLIQCEDDMRCPPSQSEILFATLRWLGRPVELLRYPGESHGMAGIGRPDRREHRLEQIVAWFEQHL